MLKQQPDKLGLALFQWTAFLLGGWLQFCPIKLEQGPSKLQLRLAGSGLSPLLSVVAWFSGPGILLESNSGRVTCCSFGVGIEISAVCSRQWADDGRKSRGRQASTRREGDEQTRGSGVLAACREGDTEEYVAPAK